MTTAADVPSNDRPNPLRKVALLLGGLFALACGVFCIGATILDRNFYSSRHTQDRVEVNAISERVLVLKVPEVLRPSRAIENESFGAMTRAAVWRSSSGSLLVVVQLPRRFDATTTVDVLAELTQMPYVIRPEEVYEHHYYGAHTATTETVQINGVKVDFAMTNALVTPVTPVTPVAVGTMGAVVAPASPITVTGVFPTKDGLTGLLFLRVLNSEVPAEQVLELVRSAK